VDDSLTSSYNRNVLGETIARRLDEMGLTQAGLAKQLDVYQQTVSKWIRGETVPRPSAVRKMEDALGYSRGALLSLVLDPDGDGPTGSPAALSGIAIDDLPPGDQQVVRDLVESLRRRREGRT
jgi:transcriptional regulator with XRE-family HTH domain